MLALTTDKAEDSGADGGAGRRSRENEWSWSTVRRGHDKMYDGTRDQALGIFQLAAMVPTSGAAGKKKRSSLLSLTRRNAEIQSEAAVLRQTDRQADEANRAAAQANDAAHQRRLALANKIVALAEAQQDEFDRWVPETPEDYTVGEYLQWYTAQPGLSMKSKVHQEASVAAFRAERKMKASVHGLDSDEDEGKTIDEKGEDNGGSRSASDDEDTESEVELLVTSVVDSYSTKQLSRLKRPSPPTISTAVKKAYIAARDRKPWEQWVENFVSFVPGQTMAERFAGTSVFHFLFHNVHPYWAEITQEPYSLASMQTSLGEEETACTFDPALPAAMHETWAWDFVSAQMRLKKAPGWVGPMYDEANSGLAATRGSPFPFVQFPSDIYEQPVWVARQNSTDPNLQCEFVAVLGQANAVRLSTGQPVDNTDVLGGQPVDVRGVTLKNR
ncbi:hypothetical protein H257_14702 [Aphanomyces astaci]|uniref:Uncharacterized protein n=1 Tax=Aphanomyces astaci TaxID=112090 RepID=W4FRK5_APHAT|nr:hypothetical protein H257_14702 [Aphanomyces astaci]ETV69571.1 hypothetical protein H257_14702 [Aphanomyces astaci]|eukprot:XP_009840898.1 hypothetical protein H257_14702 [Aphanomyces astaci]